MRVRSLIAERVRSRRKALGLSQEQLAERAGLSSNYLARLELAWNSPSLGTLISLADALNLRPADFLTSEEEWSDKARQLAHMLEELEPDQAEYVMRQLVASVEFLKHNRCVT